MLSSAVYDLLLASDGKLYIGTFNGLSIYDGQTVTSYNYKDGLPNDALSTLFEDSKGKKWYMDQAERFNAFNFNKFKGWDCTSGFKGIIIREPDGSIKRSYSCADKPLGYVESGFKLFDSPKPCISESCVSSADSKIPKRAPGATVRIYPGEKI